MCVGGNEADAVWLLDVSFELATMRRIVRLPTRISASKPHATQHVPRPGAEAGPMQGVLWSCGGLCEGGVGLALQKEAGKRDKVMTMSSGATARSRQDWTCHKNFVPWTRT